MVAGHPQQQRLGEALSHRLWLLRRQGIQLRLDLLPLCMADLAKARRGVRM